MSDVMVLHARKHQGKPPRTADSSYIAPVRQDTQTGTTVSNTTGIALTTTGAVGDQLVLKRACEGNTTWATPSSTGGRASGQLTWTLRASFAAASKSLVEIWTSNAVDSAGSITVNTNTTNIAQFKSAVLERWSGAATFDGTQRTIGLTAAATSGTFPDVHLLTTQRDNSLVSWVTADFAALAPGTPAYRSGATQEFLHDASTANYTAHYAVQTAALAGPQRVAMTTPAAGPNWSLAGIEVTSVQSAGPTQYAVSGTTPGTSAIAGTVTLLAVTSGTVASTSSTPGTVTSRLVASGTVATTSAVAGAVGLAQPVSGTVAATSDAAGSAVRAVPASGTVAATSSVAGDAVRTTPASGSVAATSTVAGDAVRTTPVSGTVAATTTTTGNAVRTASASGTVAATSGVTGSPTVLTPASGTVEATSGTLGSPTALLPASGAVASVSSVSGTASVIGASQTYPASGTVAAASTTAGSVTARLAATGTTAATSALAAQVVALLPTTGAVTVVVTIAGVAEGGITYDLTAGPPHVRYQAATPRLPSLTVGTPQRRHTAARPRVRYTAGGPRDE